MKCEHCAADVFETILLNSAAYPVDVIHLDATPDPDGPYKLRFFLRRRRRLAVSRHEWPGTEQTRAFAWREHLCPRSGDTG